jgi:hypothetical protein
MIYRNSFHAFLAELLGGKTDVTFSMVSGRVRSSMNDPGENRSYANLSKIHPLPKSTAVQRSLFIKHPLRTANDVLDGDISNKENIHALRTPVPFLATICKEGPQTQRLPEKTSKNLNMAQVKWLMIFRIRPENIRPPISN